MTPEEAEDYFEEDDPKAVEDAFAMFDSALASGNAVVITASPARTPPCVRCGLDLKPVDPTSGINQPSGGTRFVSHGHYGSTVFDPSDRSFLEINLCDPCMRVAAKDQRVLHGFPTVCRHVPKTVPWGPDGVEG